MTSLKRLTIHDLNRLKSSMYARTVSKSNLVIIYDSLSELSSIDSRSVLEAKLDRLINSYWRKGGSKELRAMLAAQKLNPRTKDIFKSKSTTHTFPWYHRKRKY